MISNNFYKSFEDAHRGSREDIKSRLQIYIPFVEKLKMIDPNPKAIDLGCGRGEWLELAKGHGIEITGAEIDNEMIAFCKTSNLNVIKKDAIQTLKDLPDCSQILITGFHLAEHIPFAELQILVKESLRVLKPAGLLILETPNPENIAVGTANFYLDPNHLKPLPPLLLLYLTQYYGFEKSKILRLQESIDLNSKRRITLHDVLAGISADYSIVAQKNSKESELKLFDTLFKSEFGVTLAQAVDLFHTQADQQFRVLEFQIRELHLQLDELNIIKSDIRKLENILFLILWIQNQVQLIKHAGLLNRLKAFLLKLYRFLYKNLDNFLKKIPKIRLIFIKILKLTKLDHYVKHNIAKSSLSEAFKSNSKSITSPCANQLTEELLTKDEIKILKMLNNTNNKDNANSN